MTCTGSVRGGRLALGRRVAVPRRCGFDTPAPTADGPRSSVATVIDAPAGAARRRRPRGTALPRGRSARRRRAGSLEFVPRTSATLDLPRADRRAEPGTACTSSWSTSRPRPHLAGDPLQRESSPPHSVSTRNTSSRARPDPRSGAGPGAERASRSAPAPWACRPESGRGPLTRSGAAPAEADSRRPACADRGGGTARAPAGRARTAIALGPDRARARSRTSNPAPRSLHVPASRERRPSWSSPARELESAELNGRPLDPPTGPAGRIPLRDLGSRTR